MVILKMEIGRWRLWVGLQVQARLSASQMMRNGNRKADVNMSVYALARGGRRLEFVDIDVDVDDDEGKDTHRNSVCSTRPSPSH